MQDLQNIFLPPDIDNYQYINRSKLISFLDSILNISNLLFVEEKQGQGKTIAIGQYVRKKKQPLIWYKLEYSDTDFSGFIKYLSEAISTKFSEFKQTSIYDLVENNLIQASDSKIYAKIIHDFLKDNLKKQELTIVFDDFYIIKDAKPMVTFFIKLLQNIPDQLKIIIISRESISGTLNNKIISDAVISEKELKLDFSEALEIADNISENPIPFNTLRKIYDYSEGWILGFVSEIYSYSGRHIHRKFIKKDLLKTINKKHLDLFTTLAYAESIDVELAEKITENKNIEYILENFYKHNPFFYKNSVKNKYYFHNIFKSALIEESVKYFSDYDIKKILIKISNFFIEKNIINKGIIYALKAKDFNRIETILQQHGIELYIENKITWFYEVVKKTDFKEIEQYPWISLFLGISILNYEPSKAVFFMDNAYKKMAAQDNKGKLFSLTLIVYFHISLSGENKIIIKKIKELEYLNKNYNYLLPPILRGKAFITISLVKTVIFSDFLSAKLYLDQASVLLKNNKNKNLVSELIIAYIYLYLFMGDHKKILIYTDELFPFFFSQKISTQTKQLILMTIMNVSFIIGDFYTYKIIRDNINEIVSINMIHQVLTWSFITMWDTAIAIYEQNITEAQRIIEQGFKKDFSSKSNHMLSVFYQYKMYIAALKKDRESFLKHSRMSFSLRKKSFSRRYLLVNKIFLCASLIKLKEYEEALNIVNNIIENKVYKDHKNLIAIYGFRILINIKLKNISLIKHDLIIFARFLKYEGNDIFFYMLDLTMIKQISFWAVKYNIEPDIFIDWTKKRAGFNFNTNKQPIPLIKVKTFGEYSFYLNGKKIFSDKDLTVKESKKMDILLSQQNKSMDIQTAAISLRDDIQKISRSSLDKSNSRLRDKLGKYITPLNPENYFIVSKGKMSFTNLETDFDEIIKYCTKGITYFYASRSWSAQSYFRKALSLCVGDFLHGASKYENLNSLYEEKIIPHVSQAAEKWAQLILETGIFLLKDIELIENIIKMDFTNINIPVLLNDIYTKNKMHEKSRSLLNLYNKAVLKSGFTKEEACEYTKSLLEAINQSL